MSTPSEPTPDLRTLAADAIDAAKLLCESPQAWHAGMARDPDPAGRVTAPCGDCLADAVLAAVLLAISDILLAKRDRLDAHPRRLGDRGLRSGGLEEAAGIVRRLADPNRQEPDHA